MDIIADFHEKYPLVSYDIFTANADLVKEQVEKGLVDVGVPLEPYTDADLDYTDNNSRSTIEMNDPSARPEIAGEVENMNDYDVIFIGYPIWWGETPRIISTFIESYDFTGKVIVPFCTSGGSRISASEGNLQALESGAEWISGSRFYSSDTREEIADWLNGLGIGVIAE